MVAQPFGDATSLPVRSQIDLDQGRGGTAPAPLSERKTATQMEDRAELLRRRIAAHRLYLATGGDIELLRKIMREIAIDEIELAAIEQRKRAEPPPDASEIEEPG